MKKRKTKYQTCRIEGCNKKGTLSQNGERYFIKGFCQSHYHALWIYGDPLAVYKRKKSKVWGGRINHSLYKTYWNMIYRCYTKKHVQYPDYGGRGIKVCKEWRGKLGFGRFLRDLGERSAGMSLGRIDNDSGYSKKNCRWETDAQQASNKRTNRSRRKECCCYRRVRRGQFVWYVDVVKNKKHNYLGSFKNTQEAIEARDAFDRVNGIIRR